MGNGTLLTSSKVAEMMSVTPGTVARWARDGILPAIRTPGGHLRFQMEDVERLLTAGVAS